MRSFPSGFYYYYPHNSTNEKYIRTYSFCCLLSSPQPAKNQAPHYSGNLQLYGLAAIKYQAGYGQQALAPATNYRAAPCSPAE